MIAALRSLIGPAEIQYLISIASILFAVAVLVVKLTPTKKDDEFLDQVKALYFKYIEEEALTSKEENKEDEIKDKDS